MHKNRVLDGLFGVCAGDALGVVMIVRKNIVPSAIYAVVTWIFVWILILTGAGTI